MEKLNPQSSYSNKKTQVISLEKGKIPPQATDLEEVVLGAMMIDKRGVDEVIDILHSEVFYNKAHQQIFHPSQPKFAISILIKTRFTT